MIRVLVATLLIGAISPAVAGAQEAIPTAAGAPAAPAPDTAAAPIRLGDQPDRYDDRGPAPGPCGGAAVKADGKPDRSPHGEVFAGVGTHGYREAGGVVCAPLGDHTWATIAIDAARIDGGSGWRR